MDLLDFFRDVHPWGKFWRLLGQLGADSRYVKAQQDDPEVAEMLAAEEDFDDPKPWKPQPADWSLEKELLAGIRDRLGDVAALLADLPTTVKKRREFPPSFPRPETELDKARKRVRAAKEQEYDDKLMDLVAEGQRRWREEQNNA